MCIILHGFFVWSSFFFLVTDLEDVDLVEAISTRVGCVYHFLLGVHYSRSSSQDPKRERLVAVEARSPILNIFRFDSGLRLFFQCFSFDLFDERDRGYLHMFDFLLCIEGSLLRSNRSTRVKVLLHFNAI